MYILKKIIKWGFLTILVFFLVSVVINLYILLIGKERIVNLKEANKADVALILGAYVTPDGQLCDMLQDRVLTGVELYKQGKVNKLLMSGDHGRKSYDEVNNMRKYAESLGVPTEDIFMDHAGFSTYESIYRARDVFKVENMIVVTQEFHLPRALYISQKLGISAVGISADRHIYYGIELNKSREILARIKAFFETGAKVKPTFLGDAIPISGDGRATHDIK